MRLRNWATIPIFISSYSPLGLILLINDIDPETGNLQNPKISISIVGISILSLVILYFTMKSIRQGDLISITRVSNKSGELLNYTIPYIISFFGLNLGDWKSMLNFSIFMLLIFILTIRTQNIFINPILAGLGYNLYDVEYIENGKPAKQSLFLSKHELSSGNKYLIRKLSKFLYFVTETKPET